MDPRPVAPESSVLADDAAQTEAFAQRGRRWGAGFALLWLFFLSEPALAAWRSRDTVGGVVGGLATLVFAVVYMAVWLTVRRERSWLAVGRPLGSSVAWFSALLALAVAMMVTLGEAGAAALVYCAVASVVLFAFRFALAIVVFTAAGSLLLASTVPGWDSGTSLAFSVVAASLAVFGIQQMVERNVQLLRAQRANAGLAVENERSRFARDLHDILGHSLTVITVKAELAQRLLDVDPARARGELADLERLSRDALADVRRAVEGFRELTLPGELARARTALAAAEIEADLPNSTDDVPSHLRELFAWTVREGITNVIRHSAAQRCSVVVGHDAVEVRDDGRGCGASGSGSGSGLRGLHERAGAVGATVVTRRLEPGYSLRVLAP